MILFIGGLEIIVILLFIVIFFGSEKIPELARGLAKTMNEIKNASNEIKQEIRKNSTEVEDSKKNKSNN
ncbi:MAG: twin-arginine translocase TatA/TatE family subunit [Flavobacteriales bacterium]|nr:twin-arginine translocase TatA/TatE family subunit [Flavobacteriales bacterium]|tara:strand:- start:1720 stop:1926 length:207 start_codon:yes stop_codon:yes gene_type:complete